MFTNLAEPLYRLTRKSIPFEWGVEQQQAFEILKEKLMNHPVLRLPDFSIPFEVQTDASGIGIGAVLSQEDQPVSYISRSLNDHEKNYSTMDKEWLEIAEKYPRACIIAFRGSGKTYFFSGYFLWIIFRDEHTAG